MASTEYVPESVPDGAACVVASGRSAACRLVAEIPTGLGPEGAAVDAGRGRAYVTSSRSNSVTVIDLDQLSAVGEIPVGEEPTDAAVDERSGRAFVCNLRSSEVTVIDLERGRVEQSIAVPAYPSAVWLDVERR